MSDSNSESDSDSMGGHGLDSGEEYNLADVDQYENDIFPAYDPDVEPEATEEEFARYEEERVREEDEEEMLRRRFLRQSDIRQW